MLSMQLRKNGIGGPANAFGVVLEKSSEGRVLDCADASDTGGRVIN